MCTEQVFEWTCFAAAEVCVLAAAATNLRDIEQRYDNGEHQDWRTPTVMLLHKVCTLPLYYIKYRHDKKQRVWAGVLFAMALVSWALWAATAGVAFDHDGRGAGAAYGVPFGLGVGGAGVAAIATWLSARRWAAARAAAAAARVAAARARTQTPPPPSPRAAWKPRPLTELQL